MKKIDLHIHTTYSDGSFTPAEIVRYAGKKGLSAIAITDHDSVSGVEEAIIAGNQLNVEVIPGIEISTEFDVNNDGTMKSVHLLGLFVDFRNTNLVRILEMRRNAQIIRNQERIKRLIDLGFDVSYEELLSYTKMQTPTKFYMSQYLVSKGISEAKELLGVGGAAYVESAFKQTFAESVGLIHQAGGLAVLAHPMLFWDVGISALEKMIVLMKDSGLDGIETYHSNNTPYTSRCMVDLADTYHLCKSGGSDFHGTKIPEIDLGTCLGGNSCVPYSILEDLRKYKSERSKK